MKQITDDFRSQLEPVLIFKPDTVLDWHRELVRRTWTFKQKSLIGRPKISPELVALVLQLARENAGWGYDRIEGELLKLGYAIDRSTIRNLLKQYRIPPVSKRRPKSTWRTFLRHYQQQMLACDFFTVETLWLKTVDVSVLLLSWQLGVSILLAVPNIQLPPGSRNKPDNSAGNSKTDSQPFAICSMITTPNFLPLSIRCLPRNKSK